MYSRSIRSVNLGWYIYLFLVNLSQYSVFKAKSHISVVFINRLKRWTQLLISNNVWFPFMYSQKWNCAASLFLKQNYNVLFPNSYTRISWEIYIFPGFVCLFCFSQICGSILGIYKSLIDTWMWKLGMRPCISQKGIHTMGFSLQWYPKSSRDEGVGGGVSIDIHCKKLKVKHPWKKTSKGV